METKVLFSNIKAEIINNLNQATRQIKVAVAWLIDEDIIRVLTHQKKAGIEVQIAISNSESNFKSNINFKEFLHLQGQLFISTKTFLHHKFCIIDDKIIINGSYNWSYQAMHSEENIMVFTLDNLIPEDASMLKKFVVKHKYLCDKCSIQVTDISVLNSFSTVPSVDLAKLEEKEIRLRQEFEGDVRNSFEEAKRLKINVSSSVFDELMADGGGVEAVKKLINDEIYTGEMKSGFKKLEQHIPPRVDLSFEYMVSRPKYQSLFSQEEVEFCKRLMQKYGF